jgi:hypothetical protein
VNRVGRISRFGIAALCLALLMLRVSGPHLHLCFDGTEPPVSYHLMDSGLVDSDAHHGEHAGAGDAHTDQDMPVAKDVLVKKPAADSTALLALVFALLLFLIAPVRESRPVFAGAALHSRSFPWLRPPLRGPPSPA